MEEQKKTDETVMGIRYGEMPDVPTALKCARHIIAVEKRWTEGILLGRSGEDIEPTCTNVKVCAVGALVLVLGDGPVIHRYFSSGGSFEGEGTFLRDHPIGKEAVTLLARAVIEREDVSAPVERVNSDSKTKLMFNRQIGAIENFNDRMDANEDDFIPVAGRSDAMKEHLNNVISVFDRAIELAESDAPVDPPATA